MRHYFNHVSLAVVAVATMINLALTITSDAQTGFDDLSAAVHRVEQRQIAGCPIP